MALRRLLADLLLRVAYRLVAGPRRFAVTMIGEFSHPENPTVVWVIVDVRDDLNELTQLKALGSAFYAHYEQRENASL